MPEGPQALIAGMINEERIHCNLIGTHAQLVWQVHFVSMMKYGAMSVIRRVGEMSLQTDGLIYVDPDDVWMSRLSV